MIVYVHDWLVFWGGAEAVLHAMMQHFGVDETTKVGVLYSTQEYIEVSGYRVPLVTALPKSINRLFAWGGRSSIGPIRRLFDYRNLMFFYPILCWLLRRKLVRLQPSQIIISSFATAKNVVPPSGWRIPSILYVHSPMQYIWENYHEYMQKLTGCKKMLFRLATWYLRVWDKKSRSYDLVYANSSYTASCVQHYYGLSSLVRYPPVDHLFLSTEYVLKPRNYFVYMGRLVRFIREVDRIILLCNEFRLPLLIAGSGPDEDYLKSLAGPTITFVGQVNDPQQKVDILKHARGLINIAKESCGLATLEALLLGVPVLGYAQGGSYEFIANDHTKKNDQGLCVTQLGVLVTKKDMPSLQIGMQEFLRVSRSRQKIQEQMRKTYTTQWSVL